MVLKPTSPTGIVKSIDLTRRTDMGGADGIIGVRIPWRLQHVRPVAAGKFRSESANGEVHAPLLTVAGDSYDLFPQIGTNDPAEVGNC
jgi:hypothetical protein